MLWKSPHQIDAYHLEIWMRKSGIWSEGARIRRKCRLTWEKLVLCDFALCFFMTMISFACQQTVKLTRILSAFQRCAVGMRGLWKTGAGIILIRSTRDGGAFSFFMEWQIKCGAWMQLSPKNHSLRERWGSQCVAWMWVAGCVIKRIKSFSTLRLEHTPKIQSDYLFTFPQFR